MPVDTRRPGRARADRLDEATVLTLQPHVPDDPIAGSPALAGAARRRWGEIAERILTLVTEVPAAALVLANMLVLLGGVVSRYALHNPLVWTDELASVLFLWLTMFGAAIALRRGEHMRLTVLVARAPAALRTWLEAFSMLVTALFCLLLLSPVQEYVSDEAFITTPALGMPNSVRVAAIAAGIGLMAAVALLRLAQRAHWRPLVGALLAVCAIGLALWLLQPALLAMGSYNLLVFFLVLVAAGVLAGVPIAFTFGMATIAYLQFATTMPLSIVVQRIDEGMLQPGAAGDPAVRVPRPADRDDRHGPRHGGLPRVPARAPARRAVLRAARRDVPGLRHLRLQGGGHGGGGTGAVPRDEAARRPPRRAGGPAVRLRRHVRDHPAQLGADHHRLGDRRVDRVAVHRGAAAGAGAGAGAGRAGVVPLRRDDRTGVVRPRPREVARSFVVALPAMALPFIIRAAVTEGIATATEVSTLGVIYAIVAGLVVYRCFDWRRIYPMLVGTAALSGAILLIIGTATSMAWALTQSGFAHALVTAISGMPGGRYGFLAASVVAFAVLGSVLEGIPAIVLFGPLLFPAARVVGVNEVHYAVVVVLSMGIGLFAPPFGVGFYTACAIGKVDPDQAMRHMWPYIAVLLAAVFLVAAIPWLSTGFL